MRPLPAPVGPRLRSRRPRTLEDSTGQKPRPIGTGTLRPRPAPPVSPDCRANLGVSLLPPLVRRPVRAGHPPAPQADRRDLDAARAQRPTYHGQPSNEIGLPTGLRAAASPYTIIPA